MTNEPAVSGIFGKNDNLVRNTQIVERFLPGISNPSDVRFSKFNNFQLFPVETFPRESHSLR